MNQEKLENKLVSSPGEGRQDRAASRHPSKFGDILGQDDLCHLLGSAVRQDRRALKLLLTGPRGTGKSALGWLAAKARLCHRPDPDGSPCGECSACESIERGGLKGAFHYINGPDDGRAEQVAKAIDTLRQRGLAVVLIDQADAIQSQAAQMLVEPLQGLDGHAWVILVTSNLDRLRQKNASLVDQFHIRRTRLVAGALLEARAAAHMVGHLSFDRSLPDQLAMHSKGSVRRLDQLVEAALERGELTSSSLEVILNERGEPDATRLMSDILDGVPLRDLDDRLRGISPEGVRAETEELLGELLIGTPAPTVEAESARSVLRARLDAAAAARGEVAERFIEHLIERWEPPDGPTSWPQVRRMLSATVRLLGNQKRNSLAPAVTTSSRGRRNGPVSSDRFLGKNDVHRLFQAASAWTQRTGSTLNIKLVLRHGERDALSPAQKISRLTHALAMHLRARGRQVFWIYLHRIRADTRQTVVALAVEQADLSHVQKWLVDYLPQIGHQGERAEVSDGHRNDLRMGFQRNVLLDFVSSVDPNIEVSDAGGGRGTLADLLDISGKVRMSLGARFTRKVVGICTAALEAAPRGAMPIKDDFKNNNWRGLRAGWELEAWSRSRDMPAPVFAEAATPPMTKRG